jgi:hypothetical protein
MTVQPLSLKQHRVRPQTPLFVLVKMPFRPSDHFLDERRSAHQADATGPCVGFEKFAIGKTANNGGFVHDATG